MKPLEGLRVLEVGTFITGPAASMLLGDLGAEVIKIERPGAGDPFRAFQGGLYSPHFQTYNRNKKSITIDFDNDDDRRAFDALAETADVLIQNFRPGAAERMGIGAVRMREIAPALVYCSISGFGSSGPSATRPAYDSVAQAASGFLAQLINPADPRVVGPAMADALTGFYAAYGILAALHKRESTGQGSLVEVSMLEAMSHFNLDAFTHYFACGEIMGPFNRPRVSQSYVMQCSDGKWLALHLSSPEKFWSGLLQAIEATALAEDPRFQTRTDRISHHEELIAELASRFRTRTRAQWCEILQSHDVPHAPMYDASEALEDEQARHLGLKVSAHHPTMGEFVTVRSPVSFDGAPIRDVTPPPVLGEHNGEILGPIRASIACLRQSA